MVSEIEIDSPYIDEDSSPTALDVSQGSPIPPLKRLEIMDEDTWEDLTLELVFFWKTQYAKVVRCGGGGDMGRDVVAYNPNGEWENFQCKYYNHPLKLNEAITEIGKLIYYSFKGEYTVPVKYYLVSPQGVATQLLNSLMDSENLRTEVLSRWDKQCKTKITKKEKVELTKELLDHINENIDFSIFDHIPPLELIDLHSQTPFHVLRFGATTRKRPKPKTPPEILTSDELIYTSELLAAFSDAENVTVNDDNLGDYSEYSDEFSSARRNFYAADSLEKFSRDWLPAGSYQDLLDDCYENITPVARIDHKDGYARYLSVSAQAANANYPSHPLHYYIKMQDKKGLCHHLVNARKVKWVK